MIRTENLRLRAGSRVLVTQLDWHVAAGQCWCIIGRNGAGKSTLLQALAGVTTPKAGSIAIAGQTLSAWPLAALARQRAYLPQVRNDAFGYRVIESVLTARHPYHDARFWDDSDDHHAALTALQALDVAHLAQHDVRTLSGGERQRVAIAALLAQQTPLLLLDEPTGALDLAHQASVASLLIDLRERQGKTVVLVSHDLNLAHAVATHALLLMPDATVAAGTVDEVMHPALLGACLGHPIETIALYGRTIFLPALASP